MRETGRKPNLSARVKRYALLLAAAWTLCAAPGFAGEARTQEPPLVIGVGLDYPPYEFLDENGKAAGYNVELTEAIAEVMELDVEVKIGPWGDIRNALEAGEIDAIAGMLYSVERDKLVDFSPPHTVVHHAIFVRRDAPAIETEEDLRGREIIVTCGDIMHDYVLEQGLSDNPVLADTQAGVLRLLASGKHDCALVAKLPGLHWSKELGLSNIEIVGPLLRPSDYSYAVTEGNTALLARLSEGLAVVGKTGRHKAIYDKWLGVLEPRGVHLNTILKYAALALAPTLLLLAAVWSRSLKRQVDRRTAELRDEIAEHMRTEEKLRESEEKFRSLSESAPVGIWHTDNEGRVLYTNKCWREITGLTLEESLGFGWSNALHPDEKKPILEGWERCLREEKGWSGEFRFISTSGDVRSVYTNTAPIRSETGQVIGHVGSNEDITERKRAQEALQESEERYRAIAEDMPVLIRRSLPGGEITYVNEAYCKYFAKRSEDLVGRSFLSLIPEADRETVMTNISALTVDSPMHSHEHRVIGPDGEIRWQRWTNRALFDAQGQAVAYQSIGEDVTARKQAEDALRFTQFSIDRVAEAAVWLGPDARFISVNEQMCRSSGYSRDELLSMSIYDIDAHMPKEEWPVFWREVKEGGSLTFESHLRTKNGQTFPVEVNANYIEFEGKEYMCAFARDITERKRAEEALHKSEERLRQIIDLVPVQIFAKNREGRILLANRAAAETLGMVPEQMTGRLHADIHPDAEEVAQMLADDIKVIESGQPLTISEESYLNSAGERRWLRTIKVPYVATDTSEPAILGVAVDITERIRAEEERRKLEIQVQTAQKLKSLGVLAGGVAHDFNNLLTSILGNADMALDTLPEASPAWQRIAHIEKASLNAADLCSQMLAYAGRGRFIVEPTKLNKVVEEMADLLRTSVSKNVVLNLHLEDSLPLVEADATQMQQVVMNLVTNASESIGEDSGVVTLTTGVMDCDRAYLSRSYLRDDQPEGSYVYIEVADTGCGMDKTTQAKMFEPFFTTKFTGRGLGLAAVLGIIRGHGGAIVVDSHPARGTTVKVLFPELEHYEPIQAEPQPSDEDHVYAFSGTVLVVDDEEVVRDISKHMLETAGFDVLTAENGYQALEIYRGNVDRIVCVLLDLTMPHMDGIKVFEQMRSVRDDVRVVLASGYSEEEISKRHAGKGIAGFIHKPYLFSTLKTKLHEALHKQSAT